MKQKLFTLLTLLLFAVTGARAEDPTPGNADDAEAPGFLDLETIDMFGN